MPKIGRYALNVIVRTETRTDLYFLMKYLKQEYKNKTVAILIKYCADKARRGELQIVLGEQKENGND